VAVGGHRRGVDLEDHRPAAPRADLDRGPGGRGQVHVMPLAAHQAALPDRRQEALDGAVVERRRRHRLRVAELDRHRVALLRPDPGAVGRQREPPLVAAGDDRLQLGAAERGAVASQRGQQLVDPDPARAIERDADRIRPVPQHVAEPLADRLRHGKSGHLATRRCPAPAAVRRSSPLTSCRGAAILCGHKRGLPRVPSLDRSMPDRPEGKGEFSPRRRWIIVCVHPRPPTLRGAWSLAAHREGCR
jgi:hypothetical protein